MFFYPKVCGRHKQNLNFIKHHAIAEEGIFRMNTYDATRNTHRKICISAYNVIRNTYKKIYNVTSLPEFCTLCAISSNIIIL